MKNGNMRTADIGDSVYYVPLALTKGEYDRRQARKADDMHFVVAGADSYHAGSGSAWTDL